MKRRHFVKMGSLITAGLPFFSIGGLVAAGGTGCNILEASDRELYDLFRSPDRGYRPFVRWWWNGDRLDRKEIIRELDILQAAGIGGVEINPIRFPDDTDTLGIRSLKWLSDEWIAMLLAALEEAKKRNIACDMIVGSGWPYGGEFLSREDQIKMVALGTKDLQGGRTYKFTRQDLLDDVNPPVYSRYGDELKELMSVMLAPSILNDLSECTDLTDQIDQDIITVKVPPGKFELYYLVKLTGYMAVINGAPGAGGPVLDHYNKQGVEKYLNRMSDRLSAHIGSLGNYFRAFFTDSLELEGANWCEDMYAEFRRRKNYDLEPYFPFILFKTGAMGNALDVKYGSEFSPVMSEDIERVRYDFEDVRVALFKERFIDTFVSWCRRNGVKSRMQAYGRPCNPLEASMIPDIPECETWLGSKAGKVFSDKDYRLGRAYTMINKYVSSAAHLSGKQLISCEEMTNVGMVFNASLNDIKVAGDQSILSGVTHSVLHGFNYSPLKAPFPGWIRYGTFFNERNTWWKFFRNWVDYKTRLYAIFQRAEMQADIAILPPLADLSGKYGFQRDPFPAFAYPPYLFQLWEAVHQNGNGCDYVTENIIRQAEVEKGGYLRYGTRRYKALLMVDVESLLPDTAEVISKFKAAGGKLIYIENAPYRSPAMKRSSEEIKKATILFKELDPAKEEIIPAPKKDFISWYRIIQRRFNLQSYVEIANPYKFVSQVYYKYKDLDIFFFSNYNEQTSHLLKAKFNISGKTAWVWDPEKGNRFIYPIQDTSDELLIPLGPSESKLIVFDKEANGEKYVLPRIDNMNTVAIPGPWKVTLNYVDGDIDTLFLDVLVDFSKKHDLQAFAGTIVYENKFSLPDTNNIKYLNLGEVFGVAEIEINNRSAGLAWYGSPLYDISRFIKPGENAIRIKVTTTLGNYIKSLKHNQVGQNWTRDQPLYPVGLVGPVQVYHSVTTAS